MKKTVFYKREYCLSRTKHIPDTTKRCSENMQEIFRRIPMPKCITLRLGCSPENFLHIFRTTFRRNTFRWLLSAFKRRPRRLLNVLAMYLQYRSCIQRRATRFLFLQRINIMIQLNFPSV